MLAAYQRLMVRHPFITQAVSAGTLGATGDAISQLFVEKKAKYDPVRSAQFFVLIAGWVTPIVYRWLRLLERVPGNPKFVPLKRMILDQTIMAPLLTTSFIFNLNLLKGKGINGAWKKTKTDIVPVMKTNYTVWPAVQLFNFYMIPLQYRIIFMQFIGLFWNTYLAYATQT